jgi:two-component system, chemotaxis family, protein-glutamate methylesterase/glutaminase
MAIQRDVVVIGGSAGAIEGMLRIAERLPTGLPARVFLVVHVPPTAPSVLPRLLERQGSLSARHPADGETTAYSVIYVAPPDFHLLVRADTVGVVRGPRENGHRPAIDPLFRSASASCGARVIGVVLSGNLDDGAVGLRAIVDAGGVALVQDPASAPHPSMPRSALAYVPEAEVASLDAIPDRIVALVGTSPADQSGHQHAGGSNGNGADPVELDLPRSQALSVSGRSTGLTCPECHGAIFQVDEPGVPTFRCRVGHAYSDNSLMAAQNGSLEAALWAAVRALEEGAAMAAHLAQRAEARGHRISVRNFRHQERQYVERMHVVRAALAIPDDVVGLPDDDEARGTI